MQTSEARRVLAAITETQRGLVTTQQAARAGVPRMDLSRMDQGGDLERVIHGIYRLCGSPDDALSDLYARWLALDPARTGPERLGDAERTIAASHRSAARVYDIGDLPAEQYTFTCSFRKQSMRTNMRLIQGSIGRTDVRIKHGMHVTTPSRTVADLYRDEPDESHVADVLADAIESGLTTRDEITAYIGTKNTDQLLAYRGLDPHTLASRLLDINGLTPAIQEILNHAADNIAMMFATRDPSGNPHAMSHAQAPLPGPKDRDIDAEGIRAVTTSMVEAAMAKELAKADWSGLLSASRTSVPVADARRG